MEKCLICGSDTHNFTHPKTGVRFHQCQKCEVIFKDNTHYPSRIDEENRYLEHNNDPSQEGYVNFLTHFIDEAVTPFISSGHILDFGSGPTPVLQLLLTNLGYDVDTYDPFFSPDKPDQEKRYDMITSTEVMEHIHQPKDALIWMDKHVEKDGFIALMTLFYPQEIQSFFQWFYIRDLSHVVFFQEKTFKVIGDMMGWNIVFNDHKRIIVFQKRG